MQVTSRKSLRVESLTEESNAAVFARDPRESSELRQLRALVFDDRVERVLVRVIEVQIRRQDFHYRGFRGLRDAPDESLRQMHLDVVLLARNRVCEGRDSHRTSDVDDKVAVPLRGAAAMAQASL